MLIYAVIHITKNRALTLDQVAVAVAAGAAGVALISHEGDDHEVVRQAYAVRHSTKGTIAVGFNLLSRIPDDAHSEADRSGLDFVWSDRPFSARGTRYRSAEVRAFGPCAFKYQREPGTLHQQALRAADSCDVVVTSGDATGQPPTPAKLREIAAALATLPDPPPLWCASGVSVQNVAALGRHLDGALVATSVNKSFHELDYHKLRQLVVAAGKIQRAHP